MNNQQPASRYRSYAALAGKIFRYAQILWALEPSSDPAPVFMDAAQAFEGGRQGERVAKKHITSVSVVRSLSSAWWSVWFPGFHEIVITRPAWILKALP